MTLSQALQYKYCIEIMLFYGGTSRLFLISQAEYRTHGVRANCLCPGATAGTDIFDTKPDQILCSLEELSRITKGARMQG